MLGLNDPHHHAPTSICMHWQRILKQSWQPFIPACRLAHWLSIKKKKNSSYKCRWCKFESLGWEDSLEKEMATHFSILAWEIPLTEEPGGYSPWSCKRVRHNSVTKQQTYSNLRNIVSLKPSWPRLLENKLHSAKKWLEKF